MEFEVFKMVFESVDELCITVLSPVVLGLSAAIQVKEEFTFAVRGILTAFPPHIVAVEALVTKGAGFIVPFRLSLH